MSRIGRLPIKIPEKVDVDFAEQVLSCKGPRGQLTMKIHADMEVRIEQNEIKVIRPGDSKKHKALHGLTRSLIANMVSGVSKGYQRKLEIVGVGYKAEMRGKHLLLNLGFSHPILLVMPENITASCPAATEIVIEGADKALVGLMAAKIRNFRPPEPYKGKGIRYAGEYVRKKAGKTGA